jgi:hypothetical protein
LFVIWLGNEPKNEEKKKWLAASRETWSLVAGNETYTHTHTVQARRCCDRGEKEEEEESFSYFFFCLLVTSFGGGNSAGTTSHLTHSRRFITNRHTEKKKKEDFLVGGGKVFSDLIWIVRVHLRSTWHAGNIDR